MIIVNTSIGKKFKVFRFVRMYSDDMEDVNFVLNGDIVVFFGVECKSGDIFMDGSVNYVMILMKVFDFVMFFVVSSKSKVESGNFSKVL